MIPLDVVDTAKLSIASDAPPKQRSKATQTRRLKTPDWEKEGRVRGCILCIPRCVESRIAGSRRGEEPSGEIFLRLIQIRLAKSSLEKIRQPVKAKVTTLKFTAVHMMG